MLSLAVFVSTFGLRDTSMRTSCRAFPFEEIPTTNGRELEDPALTSNVTVFFGSCFDKRKKR
jgi:hypothetical protein